jgi:small subunit ribosomal protein S13
MDDEQTNTSDESKEEPEPEPESEATQEPEPEQESKPEPDASTAEEPSQEDTKGKADETNEATKTTKETVKEDTTDNVKGDSEPTQDERSEEPAEDSAEQPAKDSEKPESVKPKKGKSKQPQKKDADSGEDTKEGVSENPDFKYIIRVANTNVDGNSTIPQGLTAIKGIGNRLAMIITDKLGLPRTKLVGDMSDEEVEKLSEIVDNIDEFLPTWMKNRQNDFDSGNDLHIISSEIPLTLRDDLNRLKKIRCYRGIRHEQGQKVRGQRTRANGRTGLTVGVQRKRVQQAQKKK